MALDVYELRVGFRIVNVSAQNTFHFETDQFQHPTPLHTANRIIAAWIVELLPEWTASESNDVWITGFKCRRLNNGGGPWLRSPFNFPPPPVPQESMAACVMPLITFTANIAGHWITKRLYFPGAWRNNQPANRLDLNQQFRLQVAMVDLQTAWTIDGIDLAFGIWSRTYQQFARATSIYPQAFLRTLKSRRLKLL